jgi:murein DD-endopeptidase MepM/ murein hydrolase activator NlpD
MNYNIFKSRTFWTLVVAFAYNGYAAVSGQLPAGVTVFIDLAFSLLTNYFHVAGVQNAAVASAKASVSAGSPVAASGQ